ncbi:hypothetical protein [Xiashengella succiniciproducens]|jgi:hypothetical protein|uniref:Uncharacterized protein n=1 Tax=Xiashengella succiniciproducens TaxID=2949635 RepID=A0A9J6ZRG9_9BACT|nr:hypothetical protein [Alkaliflexus sp. Ai-910]URW80548.1 hypothetical protein M9189_04190 [Alkaliflexus sp. Ai-910]
MKTLIKVNWIIFLIGFNLILNSCKKEVDSEFSAEFVYSNNSSGNIDFVLMGDILIEDKIINNTIKNFEISPNASISFNLNLPTNSKIKEMPTGILKQNNLLGDSVLITFDSEKVLKYYREPVSFDEDDEIYIEKSYTFEKTGDYSVKYTFILR